jgi:natural product biosynthesis luciferase-like monooxygenase protein
MVEHRNVVNHFVGMDARLGYDGTPGTWLAVTSLSFDISVLELFWTLARGYTVVLYREPARALAQRASAGAPALDMSLFYFSSDEAERAGDKYRLLLDGARFADTHGFVAVWTPERHFHAFGGLFPNPAVTSAAVASITSRVALRAGSCVSPLHSPIRIAEDWSIVDNISNGRVGISFAAGWQPNDFVIRPEGFADRKNQMFRDIETVRRLWRGETLPFHDATGREVPVTIYPRPVQRELPIWVTAAGNPETFEEAGRIGAHVLTHLLGQNLAELTDKIAIYRAARAAAGHEGRGNVSLMLHTFVGRDAAAAKEIVRAPMKAYLRSAVGLIKEAAWSFPTFKAGTTLSDGSFGIDHLGAEEMDALLDHAFERYYETSGLFGDVESALAFAERVRSCDVDEIACLIDFGVASDVVLEHLPMLAQVRERAALAAQVASEEGEDATIDALITRHGVTHLQCTPSMAMMLTRDESTRQALTTLGSLLVGGEALAPALARDLRALVPGQVLNVYGPTETTIWSTAWAVPADPADVSIGTPLANTDVLILDGALQPSPIGTVGELAIGGLGVTRGYLDRPELTASRFMAHPWRAGERLYRTGDLARQRPDGTLDFLGRLDHQVKVRGYRIELGEIEARLLEHPAVRESVVVAREDSAGDARLVGYLIARDGARPTNEELQAALAATLPPFMIPSAFVWLARWPLTPNGKLDRGALPRPEQARAAATPSAAPTGDLERAIAAHWCEILSVPSVGIDDNFFDLGGHSLLTVQLLSKLKPLATGPLSLVDLFRFPTVRQLARFMGDGGATAAASADGAARVEARQEGAQRRAALAQRRRGVS